MYRSVYDFDISRLITEVGRDMVSESYMAYETFKSDIMKENRINKIKKLFNI